MGFFLSHTLVQDTSSNKRTSRDGTAALVRAWKRERTSQGREACGAEEKHVGVTDGIGGRYKALSRRSETIVSQTAEVRPAWRRTRSQPPERGRKSETARLAPIHTGRTESHGAAKSGWDNGSGGAKRRRFQVQQIREIRTQCRRKRSDRSHSTHPRSSFGTNTCR